MVLAPARESWIDSYLICRMQVSSLIKAKVKRPNQALRVLARSWRNSGLGECVADRFHRGNVWKPLVTLVLQPSTPSVMFMSKL